MSFLGSTFSGVTHTLMLPLCGQTDNYGVDKLYADLRQMHFILQRVVYTRNVTPFHTFMCTRNVTAFHTFMCTRNFVYTQSGTKQ